MKRSIIDEFGCLVDDHQLRRHWPKDDPTAWYVWQCHVCGTEFESGPPPEVMGS